MSGDLIAVLSRLYRVGERLAAYDLAPLVRQAEDGMEEFTGELEEYCRQAFADIGREPDGCHLELCLRWEALGICCPHGPARIVAVRDLCESCCAAVERAGARPVTVEVRRFRPEDPPEGHYSGYCHEGIALVVIGTVPAERGMEP